MKAGQYINKYHLNKAVWNTRIMGRLKYDFYSDFSAFVATFTPGVTFKNYQTAKSKMNTLIGDILDGTYNWEMRMKVKAIWITFAKEVVQTTEEDMFAYELAAMEREKETERREKEEEQARRVEEMAGKAKKKKDSFEFNFDPRTKKSSEDFNGFNRRSYADFLRGFGLNEDFFKAAMGGNTFKSEPSGRTSRNPDFNLLGIPETASEEEIKAAFRKKAHKYHPDKGGDAAKFRELVEARDRCLQGRSRRSAYGGFNPFWTPSS